MNLGSGLQLNSHLSISVEVTSNASAQVTTSLFPACVKEMVITELVLELCRVVKAAEFSCCRRQ